LYPEVKLNELLEQRSFYVPDVLSQET